MTDSSQRGTKPQITASGIALLRCPVCHGPLAIEAVAQNEHLRCGLCSRAFPVVDGLPVLISGRSTRD